MTWTSAHPRPLWTTGTGTDPFPARSAGATGCRPRALAPRDLPRLGRGARRSAHPAPTRRRDLASALPRRLRALRGPRHAPAAHRSSLPPAPGGGRHRPECRRPLGGGPGAPHGRRRGDPAPLHRPPPAARHPGPTGAGPAGAPRAEGGHRGDDAGGHRSAPRGLGPGRRRDRRRGPARRLGHRGPRARSRAGRARTRTGICAGESGLRAGRRSGGVPSGDTPAVAGAPQRSAPPRPPVPGDGR
jgi:hypothetical protein